MKRMREEQQQQQKQSGGGRGPQQQQQGRAAQAKAAPKRNARQPKKAPPAKRAKAGSQSSPGDALAALPAAEEEPVYDHPSERAPKPAPRTDLPFNEYEWVMFDGSNDKSYVLARVLYVEEDAKQVAVQIAGKIGPSIAVVDYQLVDWNSPRLRKTNQDDRAPPDMDGPQSVFQLGDHVDVLIGHTPFRR
jgi:hypothetical protein